VVLVFLWMGFWLQYAHDGVLNDKGGFSIVFNWHPFLMVTSFVFLNFVAVVSFRTLPFSHACKKQLHLFLHAIALVLAYFGIYAVFKSHNDAKPVPLQNLYSMHSWIGMTAVVIYTLQYVIAFVYFYLRAGSNDFRGAVKRKHMPTGKLLVAAVLAAVLSGIQEKLTFNGTCTFVPKDDDDDHDDDMDQHSRILHEGHESGEMTFDCYLGNVIGILVFFLGCYVLYLLFNPKQVETENTSSKDNLELAELEELTAMDIS